MFGFLKKSSKSKKNAIVFVDFEHWYISLDRLHESKPDIKGFRDELEKDYDLKEILFFADFSNNSLRAELPKIRQITNHIIETQNASPAHKKDFTDFIMLDHIYQMAISSPDVDTFILFSGDGHFSSVVSYLISKLKKEVVVYAVRGGLSSQLKSIATRTCLYPNLTDPKIEGYKIILTSLSSLNEKKGSKSYPTFKGTVGAVARYNRMKPYSVASLLRDLIDKGCIIKDSHTFDNGKTIKTISVNWKKCKANGYWE